MEHDTPPPQCVPVPGVPNYSLPYLDQINYGPVDYRLSITMRGDDDRSVLVVFEDLHGFRVLDERDLMEFWDRYNQPNGWLWEVRSGGWLDLERQRPNFISQHFDLREYLITSGDFCVSVFSRQPPAVSEM